MKRKWPTVRLGEVLTERRETPPDEAILSGEIPVIAKIGFNDGKIELREDGKTRTKMILIRPGDLVISGINATKGAIAVYGEENESPIAATIHYSAYIPNKDRVDIRYLWWFLRSKPFRSILEQHLPGGIKTELRANRFLSIPVPLPALPEQKRLLTLIESLVSKVKVACRLRKQSAKEQAILWQRYITTILGELPYQGKLQDVLLEKPRNGWSARCDNSENGTPVLTLAAVTGFTYRSTEYKTTSEAVIPDAHYWLEPGDILITRSNTLELVGHAAIYNGEPSPCIYPDLMMKLKIDRARVLPKFLIYWLQTTIVREYIAAKAKGTSPTMKKINQDTVMNIPFPSLVSLEQQRSFVSRIDMFQTRMTAVQDLQKQTKTILDALSSSILGKAFAGEL
ncbi:hypothetical protein DRO24_00260 [Candidatus Bathyarchaeota archaeon]|nr:MAG: hypothetical protein DRO24_00260 [Candidatus Bathyarchaeota archaeon]